MIEELRRDIEWRWARSLPLRRALALVAWHWWGALDRVIGEAWRAVVVPFGGVGLRPRPPDAKRTGRS